MDCRDVAHSIDAYWDRELPPERSAQMRAHLGQCPACHEAFGQLDDWLSNPEPVVVPAGLRDRVLAGVLLAVEQRDARCGTGVPPVQEWRGIGLRPVQHGSGERATRTPGAPGSVPHETAAVGWRHHLIPLVWAGALAACIALLVVNHPATLHPADTLTAAPDPAAIPALIAAAFQPSPLAAAGAAMARVAALEQVSQAGSDAPPSLQSGRRPLRVDWVSPEADPSLQQQLPAVISAVSPLGA